MTLIMGGARSGKSRFAQSLAGQLGGEHVLFIATAEAGDAEMERRIAFHRQSRPVTWRTLETSLVSSVTDKELALQQMPMADNGPAVVLVDCITLLVSNIVCRVDVENQGHDVMSDLQSDVDREIDALCDMVRQHAIHLIIVSGEVGLGLVPESKLGRIFRDLNGFANQRLIDFADASYFMIAGRPVPLHALATNVFDVAQQLKSALAKESHAI